MSSSGVREGRETMWHAMVASHRRNARWGGRTLGDGLLLVVVSRGHCVRRDLGNVGIGREEGGSELTSQKRGLETLGPGELKNAQIPIALWSRDATALGSTLRTTICQFHRLAILLHSCCSGSAGLLASFASRCGRTAADGACRDELSSMRRSSEDGEAKGGGNSLLRTCLKTSNVNRRQF